MTTTERLMPCPFCGPGQSQVDLWHDDVSKRWRVGCGRCGCSTGIHPRDKTEAPAIAAWNRRALSSTLEAPAELLQLHRDAVNACVSWKLGEVTEGDAAKVEAAFRDALSRAIEPREKRELRLIKDCEELTEVIAALQAEAQAVAPADVREVAGRLVRRWCEGVRTIDGGPMVYGYEDILCDAITAALSAHGTDKRAAGVEAAAKWHDERAMNTPDAFESEFHAVSAAALRAIRPDDERKP